MKQFIVLCAVLPLLMVFLLQFALDQQNDVRIGIVNDIVYAAKEEAKQEGCFTKEIQSRMREQIAGRLHVSPQEIRITATETPIPDHRNGAPYGRLDPSGHDRI